MSEATQKVNTVEIESKETYTKTLEEIRGLIPETFQEKGGKSGVSFFGERRTRLLKMVETKKGLRVEFNVQVPEVVGMVIYTEQQAKDKHMGTCRWVYSGNDIELIKDLVKQAVTGFAPKKRSDSFEEKEKAKDKKEDPKAETKAEDKKEDKKKEEPKKEEAKKKDDKKSGTVTSRKMTEEEMAKLNTNKSDLEKEKDKVKSMKEAK